MDLDEVLRAGHRQHRLDALLDAGQLQVAAGVVHLPVEIHQAADGGAVHVGDRRQVDEDVALAAGDQRADRRREIGEDRIHQPRFADPDDGDAAGLFGLHIHRYAPVRARDRRETTCSRLCTPSPPQLRRHLAAPARCGRG